MIRVHQYVSACVSLCVAVIICVILVNIQTYRHTQTDRFSLLILRAQPAQRK